MYVCVQEDPIEPGLVQAAVEHPSCGAVLVFSGVVRDHHEGRRVDSLSYEAYAPMAEKVLASIAQQAARLHPGARVAIVHRTGRLSVGETSIVIAVASPHRDQAYAASRYCIDQTKSLAPIWKREESHDGSHRWISNPESTKGRPSLDDQS